MGYFHHPRETLGRALDLNRGSENCVEWGDEIKNFVLRYRSELYLEIRDIRPLSHARRAELIIACLKNAREMCRDKELLHKISLRFH